MDDGRVLMGKSSINKLLVKLLGSDMDGAPTVGIADPRMPAVTPDADDQIHGNRRFTTVASIASVMLFFAFFEMEGCAQKEHSGTNFAFSQSEASSLTGSIGQCTEPVPGQADLQQLSDKCVKEASALEGLN